MPCRLKSMMKGLGGARRDRTDDLVNAIHALSQLSYGPFAKTEIRDRKCGRRNSDRFT